MSKHCSKEYWELIDRARAAGFTCTERNGKVVVVAPDEIRAKLPVMLKQYIAHIGDKSLHPVRRYIKNQCGVTNFA